jgi:hypothetical protein
VIIFVTAGREVDRSPPPTAKVKNGRAIPPFSIGLHGMVLNQLSTGTIQFCLYLRNSGTLSAIIDSCLNYLNEHEGQWNIK